MDLITAVQENPTMTSTQFCEMTGREKKHINEKIKKEFSEEIEGQIIRPTLRSNGQVLDYHLPETESVMLAAMLDKSYLRKISEFWKNRNEATVVPEPVVPLLPMQIAEITAESSLRLYALFEVPKHYAMIETVKHIEQQSGLALPLLENSRAMDDIQPDEVMLEPTDLGEHFGLSAIKMNRKLAELGLQVKKSSGWEPTDLGKPHCESHAWNKGSKSGYNLKWKLEVVRDFLEETDE